MPDNLFKNRTRLIQITFVAVFLLPLLAHLYAGQFTRMMADDYCYGFTVASKGWWGAMTYWYESWTGAYSATALLNVLTVPGTSLGHYLPAMLLIFWLVALVWMIYQFARIAHLRQPVFTAIFLGTFLLYAVIAGAPNISQTLYWIAGAVTYIIPLILLIFHIGFILFVLRRTPPGKIPAAMVLASAGITFAAGGFSTMIIAAQGGLMLLGIGLCLLAGTPALRRTAIPLLAAGLAGSVLSLLIMLAAPGTSFRQARFPDPAPPLKLLVMNGLFLASFLATVLAFFSTLEAIITLVVPGIIANKTQPQAPAIQARIKRHARRYMALALVIGLGLLYGIFLPSTYNVSDLPPARALIIPHFVMIFIILAWGVIMGLSLQRPQRQNTDNPFTFSRVTLIALVILLILGPIRSTWNTLRLAGDFRTFAAEWDARDRAIRAAVTEGKTEMIVPAFTVDLAGYANIGSIDDDPDTGTNVCAAAYYGLESLTAEKPDKKDTEASD